jgi:prepilin-type N-terminal cleavage/methylation domain-containing protein
MERTSQRRRGVSLLELLVVVTLIGIFSSVAMARFGRSLFGDFGSQSDVRRLALALHRAQRLAIATGDNHYVELTASGGKTVGYQLYRRAGSGPVPVDVPQSFTPEVSVSATHTQMEFTFEGQALDAYRVRFSGPNRQWTLTVVPVTGLARVTSP